MRMMLFHEMVIPVLCVVSQVFFGCSFGRSSVLLLLRVHSFFLASKFIRINEYVEIFFTEASEVVFYDYHFLSRRCSLGNLENR